MGFDTDEGCYTYHYELKDWDLFQCKELDKGKPWDGHTSKDVRRLLSIPAADVSLVRHGKWVHSRYENCSEQFEIVKCSCCGHEAYAMAFYVRGGNYCPNCGAKMDGGRVEGEENETEELG